MTWDEKYEKCRKVFASCRTHKQIKCALKYYELLIRQTPIEEFVHLGEMIKWAKNYSWRNYREQQGGE